jgi:hypothetical protein
VGYRCSPVNAGRRAKICSSQEQISGDFRPAACGCGKTCLDQLATALNLGRIDDLGKLDDRLVGAIGGRMRGVSPPPEMTNTPSSGDVTVTSTVWLISPATAPMALATPASDGMTDSAFSIAAMEG